MACIKPIGLQRVIPSSIAAVVQHVLFPQFHDLLSLSLESERDSLPKH